ncbi:MAG: PIN domain-containing protein [Deltaproteobacteria bacterium]|nr:PIN domain-containing protein [Deltaproteobacteria bacterium]
MIIVDTSVWIEILRDRNGEVVRLFRRKVGAEIYVLTRFTQLELLQGARDEYEWKKLEEYLSTQLYIETTDKTWPAAARIYYDLRRSGITINSPIDCCIAQIAIETNAILLHKDQDFEKITAIRPLNTLAFN